MGKTFSLIKVLILVPFLEAAFIEPLFFIFKKSKKHSMTFKLKYLLRNIFIMYYLECVVYTSKACAEFSQDVRVHNYMNLNFLLWSR